MPKTILMFTVSPSSEIFGLNVNFVSSVSGTYPNQSVLDWRKMTVLNEDYEFCVT